MGTRDEDAKPRRLGPKRASNIRKLFNLEKNDDVRQYVVRRDVKGKSKAPKIQRLLTPAVLQHKRKRALKKVTARDKAKKEAAEYKRLSLQRAQEKKQARADSIARRRSSRKSSKK